jgi:hypothetical protein
VRAREVRAFLVRETGWTLEYIESLSLRVGVLEVYRLVGDMRLLKRQDEYHRDRITMLTRCRFDDDVLIEDIIGAPPKSPYQKEKETSIWLLAKSQGVRVPQLPT